MAAILNGLLPAKKKDQYSHLNTRWGDAAISAPIHGGWSSSRNSAPSQESPDLERDLPPTPPQHMGEADGVFIVHDEEEENHLAEDAINDQERGNVPLNMTLPAWKRKSSHSRKQSQPTHPVLKPKFAPPRRGNFTPPLGTAEAAATVPLPDSRVNSPISRTTTTPVLSFRSRLANPSLSDMLSPVAEGFAKDGPSTRSAHMMSSLEIQDDPTERSVTASSLRPNVARRPSLTAAYNSEGLGGMTVNSQATIEEQLPEFNRQQSRGLGVTAHMRTSSRGPRASSRGARSTSIEPAPQRAGSVEPITRRAPSVESATRRAPSVEASSRRAPSVEAATRRAPSVEAYNRRAPSVEPIARRTPSVEPTFRKMPPIESVALRSIPIEPHNQGAASVQTYTRQTSVGPIATRGRSVDEYSRRAHSVEPYAQRAPSIEPVARRGQSVDQRSSRGHSVEPYARRAPSLGPVATRGHSVDQYSRIGHSVEPLTLRGKSVEPYGHQHEAEPSPRIPAVYDLEPLRRRAPSMEPTRRRAPSTDPGNRRGFSLDPAPRGKSVDPKTGRAPSLGPPSSVRRAPSREPRGRRGASIGPSPQLRFHSEVARPPQRRDSFSSNDGSLESDNDREDFDLEYFSPPSRADPDFTSARKSRRRRSIASPMVSPMVAAFASRPQNNGLPSSPPLVTNFDSTTSRAGVTRHIITPVEKQSASRSQSQSRTRGFYGDLHDDFSMLAREVQKGGRRETPIEAPSIIPQLPRTVFDPPTLNTQLPRNVLNSSQQSAPPIMGPHLPRYQAGIGTLVISQWGPDQNRKKNTQADVYYSDPSQCSQTSNSNSTNNISSDSDHSNNIVPRAILAGITRDRHDQSRREEREKARERVTKRLERESERILASNVFSGSESESQSHPSKSGSGNTTGNRTRQVYGSSVASDSEAESGWRDPGKVLVPDDVEIWG